MGEVKKIGFPLSPELQNPQNLDDPSIHGKYSIYGDARRESTLAKRFIFAILVSSGVS